MKKLLTILLACLMVCTMVGCSSEEKEEETTTEVKVAVLIPFKGDQSYWDTLVNGATALNDADNGITVDVFECDKSGAAEAENWANWYADVCEDGEYDLVVSGNNTYEPFLYTACEKYPDQLFFNFDYEVLPEGGVPANCYCVSYALDDLGYVVGALSSALTETGIVGVVVGKDMQGMNQFIGGYCQVLAAQGKQYIINYPDSFTDTALGYTTTQAMIEKGADVIWQVAGGLGNGVINACAEARTNGKNVWCVGVDQDQYAQFIESQPDWANAVITSALKNTDVALTTVVGWLQDGTLEASKLGTTEVFGIALNGVGVAENEYYLANVSEEVRAELADILAQVANGEIEVFDTKALSSEEYDAQWPAVRDAARLS